MPSECGGCERENLRSDCDNPRSIAAGRTPKHDKLVRNGKVYREGKTATAHC
ncbi:MAG: hypothetical protein WBB29_03095 [Geitlerinemataceae cyanobacterium]